MIVAVINNKGGVGKTTSAVNLSAAWARAGLSTLLVDLDSQCSASLHVGFRANALPRGKAAVATLLSGGQAEPCRCGVEGLNLLAGSSELGYSDRARARRARSLQTLGQGLDKLSNHYERIVLDCPPSLSFLTSSAILAAEALLVPVTPSYLAVEGLVQFMDAVRRLQVQKDASTQQIGILLTMVDSRMRLTGEVIELVRGHYGDAVLNTEVKVNVKLAEASSFGQSIFEYDARCPGAKLYRQLVDELEEKWLVQAAVA